jgi:hypothetical protein
MTRSIHSRNAGQRRHSFDKHTIAPFDQMKTLKLIRDQETDGRRLLCYADLTATGRHLN